MRGGIEIGMHRNQGDVMLSQIQQHASLRCIIVDTLYGLKDKRMVRQDELRACICRFCDDLWCQFKRHKDAFNLSSFPSQLKADVVPVLGCLFRKTGCNDPVNFT